MSELNSFIDKPSYNKIKLLSGKSIGIRPWVMKEEKDFLFAIETKLDDKDLLIEQALKLAKKCVDKPGLFDTLSKNDCIFILAQLRKISKGQEIEIDYRCNNTKCPTFVPFDEKRQEETGLEGQGNIPLQGAINLDSEVKTKLFNSKPFVIGNYKIYLKEVPFSKQTELENKHLTNLNLNAFNWFFVLNSIAAIEKDDKKIDDFTWKELVAFADSFSSTEFKELSEKIGDHLSEFEIEKKVSCPSCKNEMTILYEEIFSLLVF